MLVRHCQPDYCGAGGAGNGESATGQGRRLRPLLPLRRAAVQSLRRADPREAEARRKRVEATILDLTTGRLRLPDDCPDLGTFILSDGSVTEKPQPPDLPTLQVVWDRYQAD